MEGGDPIVEPAQLETWWDAGLRCLGLCHYARSRYAVGTGDDGPLTQHAAPLLK